MFPALPKLAPLGAHGRVWVTATPSAGEPKNLSHMVQLQVAVFCDGYAVVLRP